MSKKPTFLIWDASTCNADSVSIISKVQETIGRKFSSIFIYAEDANSLPKGVSELSIATNTVMRFGDLALYDIIPDIVGAITNVNSFDVCVFSSSLSIWFSLFQNIQPEGFRIFSMNDPRDDLDFSFLPMTIPTVLYKWPSLELISEDLSIDAISRETAIDASNEEEDIQNDDEEPQQVTPEKRKIHLKHNYKFMPQEQAYDDINEEEEEDLADEIQDQSYGASPIISQTQKINETQNLLESNKRLNFKSSTQKDFVDSPVQDSPPMHSHKNSRKKSTGAGTAQVIPLQFRPLIESMKSVGKSMVSLTDFESHLKALARIEQIQAPDAMDLIQMGVDEGLVIFDRTINYLRFRNRALSTAQIKYE